MSDAQQVARGEVPVCKGRNCYSTTGEHSPECLIEAAEAQGWKDDPVIQAARLFLRLRNEPVLPPPPANLPPRSATMPGTLDQNGTAAAMLHATEALEAPMPTTELQAQVIARGELAGKLMAAEAEIERLRDGIRGYLEIVTADPSLSRLVQAGALLRALLDAPTEPNHTNEGA